jgi:uncharacterized protein (TIGR02678 family)
VTGEGIRDTELADYQRAARIVLVHPLVTTSHPNGTALVLVRRFARPLATDLATVAGYRLELEPTCARLVRRIDRLDDTQRVRRRDGKPFDRRRYAYLCLVLAALGRAGAQVALTELADALRRRAAEVSDLGFDPDDYRHRLAFVDVVRHLLDLGGLHEVESSTVDWVRDPDAGEALYDVDRDVVHLTFVPPRVVQHVTSTTAFLAGTAAVSRDTRREATRQRLARRLLEAPVVHLDDLDGAERAYLASQAASLTADLERLTGGQVERRAEGLALLDATGGFTDRRFPAGGTAAQVALLLVDAMARAVAADEVPTASCPRDAERVAALVDRLDAARPHAPAVLVDDPDAEVADAARSDHATDAPFADDPPSDEGDGTAGGAVGPLFTTAWLRDRVAGLIASHGRAFAADLRDDPDGLARAAVEVLTAFDLVREVPGGVVARPVAARYRDVAVTTVAAQPSLLDAAEVP